MSLTSREKMVARSVGLKGHWLSDSHRWNGIWLTKDVEARIITFRHFRPAHKNVKHGKSK